jgi:hypothetical protein
MDESVMAKVLHFPIEHSAAGACVPATGSPPALCEDNLLEGVRRDIRHSLLLLDIAVFQLRETMPKQARDAFAPHLATDELLDGARTAARLI